MLFNGFIACDFCDRMFRADFIVTFTGIGPLRFEPPQHACRVCVVKKAFMTQEEVNEHLRQKEEARRADDGRVVDGGDGAAPAPATAAEAEVGLVAILVHAGA